MSDLRQCSHDFLSEFIELYRSFPCLWQVKSKEYSDRDRKNQAYEIVVEKFKQVDPTATRDTVIKKINSLRTVYRKELAKVKQSIHSGAADEDIYKPTLWYFDLLSFLGDQDTPRRSRNTADDETTQGSEDTEECERETHHSDVEKESAPSTPLSVSSEINEPSRIRSKSSVRKRKLDIDTKTTELMAVVGKKLNDIDINKKDLFDIFGQHVANKLRTLCKEQNIFAQKLINDVLFEAEMESLTRNCRVLREPQNFTGGHGRQQNSWPQTTHFQYVPNQFSQTSYSQPTIIQHIPNATMQQPMSSQIGLQQNISEQIRPAQHQIRVDNIQESTQGSETRSVENTGTFYLTDYIKNFDGHE
ncbi:hypothetical protein ABEB36_013018 [Hypothenemus hampei]|uniref:MADF domain-containing protein n=1 Tax=Hypothenemus hampei TaxID=57062 RepID=A0ABD1E6J9_HYPHA